MSFSFSVTNEEVTTCSEGVSKGKKQIAAIVMQDSQFMHVLRSTKNGRAGLKGKFEQKHDDNLKDCDLQCAHLSSMFVIGKQVLLVILLFI